MSKSKPMTAAAVKAGAKNNVKYLEELGWTVHESIEVEPVAGPWDQWLLISGPNGKKSIGYMEIHPGKSASPARDSFVLEDESPKPTCPIELIGKADPATRAPANRWREKVAHQHRIAEAVQALEPGAWVRWRGEWLILVARTDTGAWRAQPGKFSRAFSQEEVILTAELVLELVTLHEYRLKWCTDFERTPPEHGGLQLETACFSFEE